MPADVMIRVLDDDITTQAVEALILPLVSDGGWMGAIDGVLRHKFGEYFHDQARDAMPLRDGDTVLARSNGRAPFASILFVIDDLVQPLQQVVRQGLLAAERHHLNSVALPVMRTGAVANVVETPEKARESLATAVKTIGRETTLPQEIRIVTFRDPQAERHLLRLLGPGF